MLDKFVLIDGHVALFAGDHVRDDLVLELAGLLRGLGLVLRGDREGVLLGAADLPFGGDVLGGDAHVVIIEDVGEAVDDHRIGEFDLAHLRAVAQMRGVSRERHALLAAGDDDPGVARLDLLGGERHGAQTRSANLVNAESGRALGNASLDGGLAGGVLPVAGGQHLTEDHFADLVGGDARARKGRLDDGRAEVVGGDAAESSVERSDGGARRGNDHDIGRHVDLLKIGRTR